MSVSSLSVYPQRYEQHNEIAAGGTFDGTNDYMSIGSALLGSAPNNGVFSCWFKAASLGANMTFIEVPSGLSQPVYVYTNGSGQLRGPGLGNIVWSNFDTDFDDGEWHHLICSWDGPSGPSQMAVDGVYSNETRLGIAPAWATPTSWHIGADSSNNNKFNGSLAEIFYHNPASYFDISDKGNLRKFYTSSGRPAFLGSDGSKPLGEQPLLYFEGAGSGLNVNSGSASNFTITGSLGTPSDTPSKP